MRVADELRGSSASFSVAANRSSIGFFLSAMMAFSLARLGAAFLVICLRRLFFSIELFFAMLGSWVSAFERLTSVSLPEREIECAQQCSSFVVGPLLIRQPPRSTPFPSTPLFRAPGGDRPP